MSKTAADQIVEMMIEVGIQRVYGLVGDSINPITDAIRQTKGKLQWVLELAKDNIREITGVL